MTEAPFISTFIAIGLIPVAFLFAHAYLSGIKGWRFHPLTGTLAVLWDLSLSIGYMIYRSLGGKVEGGSLVFTHFLFAYFIIHGLVALVVIILECGVLITGLIQWRKGRPLIWHKKIGKILFILWWFAFITGELFYIAVYLL